jgi:hypothetical protein
MNYYKGKFIAVGFNQRKKGFNRVLALAKIKQIQNSTFEIRNHYYLCPIILKGCLALER